MHERCQKTYLAIIQAFSIICHEAQASACPLANSEHLLCCEMVSVGRLQWLARQIHSGRAASVCSSYNQSREKVSFILETETGDACIPVYRLCVMGALSAVQQAMQFSVVTDKGHRSSSEQSWNFGFNKFSRSSRLKWTHRHPLCMMTPA